MASERRFAALAQLRRRPEGEEARSDAATSAAAIPPAPAPRPQGRPPGKRSDPDWKPRTILMRTKTHRRVAGVLLERDDGPDLSELVDELLTEWLTKQ
jgi:hypothetical protein